MSSHLNLHYFLIVLASILVDAVYFGKFVLFIFSDDSYIFASFSLEEPPARKVLCLLSYYGMVSANYKALMMTVFNDFQFHTWQLSKSSMHLNTILLCFAQIFSQKR